MISLRETLLVHAEMEPDQTYVRCVFPDGGASRMTYGTLVRRGSQIVRELRRRKTPGGSVVIIILPHSTDLYSAFFGAILGGFVPSILAVPSFKQNAGHYQQEVLALMARTGAGALITDGAVASRLGFQGSASSAPAILVEDIVGDAAPVPNAHPRGNDVVLLQHSSGSTGLKKGVALTNDAVLSQIEAYGSTLDLQPADRIASWLPLYHDMGLIACAVLPMVRAIPVSALDPFHWVTRPASLLKVISDDRCTLAWQPNFAYEFLAKSVRPSQVEGVRLDSMRGWINCSEPTLALSHRRFHSAFAGLGVRPETLWTCYAAAETTFAVTQSSGKHPPRVERVDRERLRTTREVLPSVTEEAVELMSAGPPIPGTRVRVISEHGTDLSERRVGEIVVASPSLFHGYFRDPGGTARALRDEWYFSGDLGYLAEGHVFVTGRKKDLIIVAGRNYYPHDIERIVSAVPGVHPGRVVALGIDDEALGTQRVVVLAEVDDPALIDSSKLAETIRTTVIQELDCPLHDVRLLTHMWLLKTSSGKIARAPNLARYLQDLVKLRR